MVLAPGTMFGRYRVVARLGEGGMGTVYRATDTRLERDVALKLLHRNEERSGRGLLEEARAAAKLGHAGFVAIYDVGDVDGTAYIAMELVVGRPLRASVGDRSLPIVARVKLLADVARSLAIAHRAGLVHRDVKPENVMVGDDGTVKLLDFGIAAIAGDALPEGPVKSWTDDEAERFLSTFTREGSIVGTPRYMAPEQLEGRAADGRSDQFAWGVMAYELLAGKPPWIAGELTFGALLDRLDRKPSPLRTANPDVPQSLAEIVDRAMNVERDRRFPSMDEVVRALERTTRSRARWLPIALATAGIVTAAGFALSRGGAPAPTASPAASSAPVALAAFRPANARRLTFGEGCEEFPSFTPDGRHVVFDETRGPLSSIMILSLDDGTERELTHPKAWDYAADVSPDGRSIAFLRSDEDGAIGTYVVDIEGKTEPRFIAAGHVRPSFSPDGAAVWAGDGKAPTRYALATGLPTRSVLSPDGTLVPLGRELESGQYVAVFPGGNATVLPGIAELSADGGTRWLVKDTVVEVFAPLPQRHALISARRTAANNIEIFSFDLDGGAPQVLVSPDVLPVEGMRFDREGRAVVWSNCTDASSVMRIDAHEALSQLHPGTTWNESAIAGIPGATELVAVSTRMGPTSAWIVGGDGTYTSRELDARTTATPTAIAVSKENAIMELGEGLAVVPLDGKKRRLLTTDPRDGDPAFSADGSTVLFTRTLTDGTTRVLSIPIGGGDAQAVLPPSTRGGVLAADDRMAYLEGADRNQLMPMLHDPNLVHDVPLVASLPRGSYRALAFSPDKKRLAMLVGGNVMLEIDVDKRAVTRKISGGSHQLQSPTWLGGELLVIGTEWRGDVWIADGPF